MRRSFSLGKFQNNMYQAKKMQQMMRSSRGHEALSGFLKGSNELAKSLDRSNGVKTDLRGSGGGFFT